MAADSPRNREPRQARSRESFERVIEATLELLRERSYDQITLVDIGRRAGVSTGSMYGRIDCKDGLLQVVQSRFNLSFSEESHRLKASIESLTPHLALVVPAVVQGLAMLLQRHAPVLRALMLAAVQNESISSVGNAFAKQNLGLYADLLMQCRSEILHPRPEQAVTSAIQILYTSLARYLRLESVGDVGHEDWETLNADLADMVLAFLWFPGRPSTSGAPRVRPRKVI